ncbi:MAG: extracellular solute-binding protein [Chloroflexota bacterium]|nr:MAG: extracellular solute-binding protein [Chloroflexota bacterium]
MNRLIMVLLFLIILLPGCSLLGGEEAPDGEDAPPTATATPGATPTAAATPQATEAVDSEEEPPIRIWVVEELSPGANVPGGSIVAEQLAAYETNHPEVQLEVEVKSGLGRGSIISYLRFGGDVAPSVLPDVIAVPVDGLSAAANEGLIFPLGGFIDQADADDLFPAAQELSKVNDQMVGYPMTLSNLGHMAYSTAIFTETVPLTWEAFLQPEQVTFAFPGAGLAGAEMLLQQYLAEGGALTDESNQPALQVEPLTAALQRYSEGRATEVILLETSSLTSLSESWQTFGTLANTVQTVDSQYLARRDEGIDSAFAGIPGPEQPLAPLVSGWAWAISSPDPARQEIAADVLNWLIAGPNIGDWSLAAARLPARRSSFEQWPADDDYTEFLIQELDRAEPFPEIATGAVLDALGTALFDVLSLASSPEAAAMQAVDSLRQ